MSELTVGRIEQLTHTKGPWQTCKRHKIEIGNFIAVRPVSDEPPVAYVADDVDARLIAAAPDLLAACKALLRFFEGDKTTWAEADAARAAIAKAEGKD